MSNHKLALLQQYQRMPALADLYRKVKQIQKHLGISLQQLEQQYSTSMDKINQLTARKIQEIHVTKEHFMQQIQKTKSQAVMGLQNKWKQFKNYSKIVRKTFLGQSIDQDLPSYSLGPLQLQLHNIEDSVVRITALLQNFKEQIFGDHQCQKIAVQPLRKQENQKQLSLSFSLPINKPQSVIKKITTQESIQISPIKNKKDKAEMHPERDQPQSQQPIRAFNRSPNNQPISAFKVQMVKSLRLLAQGQVVKSQLQPKLQLKDVRMKKSVSPVVSVRSPLVISQSKARGEVQFSIRSSGLERIKSQQVLGRGYKNCLQSLQKQQLRFDRQRYG